MLLRVCLSSRRSHQRTGQKFKSAKREFVTIASIAYVYNDLWLWPVVSAQMGHGGKGQGSKGFEAWDFRTRITFLRLGLTNQRRAIAFLLSTMDTFDNFQYESASSYGGALSVVDDNSSVYTANTQTHSTLDLESLSISDYSAINTNGHADHQHIHNQGRPAIDEDFDAVLDELKDEGAVDLPPHACRYGVNISITRSFSPLWLIR
jgi:hypothetical protein